MLTPIILPEFSNETLIGDNRKLKVIDSTIFRLKLENPDRAVEDIASVYTTALASEEARTLFPQGKLKGLYRRSAAYQILIGTYSSMKVASDVFDENNESASLCLKKRYASQVAEVDRPKVAAQVAAHMMRRSHSSIEECIAYVLKQQKKREDKSMQSSTPKRDPVKVLYISTGYKLWHNLSSLFEDMGCSVENANVYAIADLKYLSQRIKQSSPTIIVAEWDGAISSSHLIEMLSKLSCRVIWLSGEDKGVVNDTGSPVLNILDTEWSIKLCHKVTHPESVPVPTMPQKLTKLLNREMIQWKYFTVHSREGRLLNYSEDFLIEIPIGRLFESTDIRTLLRTYQRQLHTGEVEEKSPHWVNDERAITNCVKLLQVASLNMENRFISANELRNAIRSIEYYSVVVPFSPFYDIFIGADTVRGNQLNWESDADLLEIAILRHFSHCNIPYPDFAYMPIVDSKIEGNTVVERARNFAKEHNLKFDEFLERVFELRLIEHCRRWLPFQKMGVMENGVSWFDLDTDISNHSHVEQTGMIAKFLQGRRSDISNINDIRIWLIGGYNGEELFSLASDLRIMFLNDLPITFIGTDIIPPDVSKIMTVSYQSLLKRYGDEKLVSKYFDLLELDNGRPSAAFLKEVTLKQGDDREEDCLVIVCNGVLAILDNKGKEAALNNIFSSLQIGGRAFFENDTWSKDPLGDICAPAHQAIIRYIENYNKTNKDFELSIEWQQVSDIPYCRKIVVQKNLKSSFY